MNSKADSLFKEGVALYKQKDYSGAIEKFIEVGNIDPLYPEVDKYLNLAYQGQEESQKKNLRGGAKMATRWKEISDLLDDIRSLTPGIEGVCLVDMEGGMMASTSLPEGVNEDTISGMAAGITGIVERMEKEQLKKVDHWKRIRFNWKSGDVIFFAVMRQPTREEPEKLEAILVAITSEKAKIGLVYYDMENTVKKIQKCLP